MEDKIFIKHKVVDQIPSSPEVGSIYYERTTGIEKIVESADNTIEVGNIELMLSAKIGEGQNSNIFNDLDNVASGENSHAEGSNTSATGQCAHAEGSSTIASGEFAHAEGYNTVADGDFSHAEGYGTQTKNETEHAAGKWNISDDTVGSKTMVTVGNGTDAENRKNIYELREDGSQYLIGVGNYDGTNGSTANSVQEVITELVTDVNNIDTSVFQAKTDNTLKTTDKTVSGAINELYDSQLTAGNGISITDHQINVTLDTDVFKVVTVLPAQPDAGNEKKIHIVPATSTGTQNLYDEYVWVNDAWELLGQFQPVIDLDPYLTKTEAEGLYQPKGSYQTTLVAGNLINIDGPEISVDLDPLLYQTKTDNSLQTIDKTIVGAINEVTNLVPLVTVVPELTSNYTIQANPSIRYQKYIIPVGATTYNILYSGDITWKDASTPIVNANHTYIVTVLYNLASWEEY